MTKIMETHAHTDHLTAATYLQQKLTSPDLRQTHPRLRPAICIHQRITIVQATFSSKYNIDVHTLVNIFDKLFTDNEDFAIGAVPARVLHLPGHTPDHVGYMIGENFFTGDSIFNPDVGSARGFPMRPVTDPASGSRKRIVLYTTVGKQRARNRHVKEGTTEEYVSFRSERDAVLGELRLLHQAMQVNIRAGRFPCPTSAGDRLVHVPVKGPKELLGIM